MTEPVEMCYLAVFDTATGQIVRTTLCPLSVADDQPNEGEDCLPVEDHVTDSSHYADIEEYHRGLRSGIIKPRAEPDVSMVVSGMRATIEGIPGGCAVEIGPQVIETSENLEIEFDIPGEYTVVLGETVRTFSKAIKVEVDDQD